MRSGEPGYLEASLRRLGTDRVDLYYPHFPDPRVPIEDTVAAVAELVDEGLVGHVGLSNVTVQQLARAARVHPIAAVQVEWSLWSRGAERELLPLARGLGAGLVAWGPLGNGFLAGEVALADDDFRRHAPRFQGGNLARNRDRFAPLRRIAREAGVTPAQLALSWLWAGTSGPSPSRAAGRRRTSTRTSPRPRSGSTRRRWRESTRRRPRSRPPGARCSRACASRPRRYPERVVGRGESAWWRRR